MSWLAERKNKQGKTVTWLYRWKDSFGVEHQRSTKEKDKKSAIRVQKHWDAYLLINGKLPDDNYTVEEQTQNSELQAQIERFLVHKSCELKETTLKRYRNHFDAILEFFKQKKIFYLDQLSTSVLLDYKCERLKSGISYKTVAEDLSILRSLIRGLVEEDIIERDPVKKWPEIPKKIPKRPKPWDLILMMKLTKYLLMQKSLNPSSTQLQLLHSMPGFARVRLET